MFDTKILMKRTQQNVYDLLSRDATHFVKRCYLHSGLVFLLQSYHFMAHFLTQTRKAKDQNSRLFSEI